MHNLIHFLYYIGMGSIDFPILLVAITFQLLLFGGIGSDDFSMLLVATTFHFVINVLPWVATTFPYCW
jgi:hypothetical protein